jgi:hypothetical protein
MPRPEHAVTIALAATNEDPAALMARQIGWRFLEREGREEDGRLQSRLPQASGEQTHDEEAHAHPPPDRFAILSAGLLLVSLVAVVGLAKILTPTVNLE